MDTTKVPLGRTSAPFETTCDPGEIAAFALAVNDDSPLYADGRAVPPTYAAVPGLQPFLASVALPAEATESGFGAGHGEHDLHIHKVPRPGTVLTTTSEVCSVSVNKAGMNVFNRVASVDEAGELVYEQFWSVMYVGPTTGGDQGRELADHSFPDEARSRPVGTMVLGTTADQTFRYAGASGDRAIIHVDDRAAKRATGSDRGKFLQGLCTLGIGTRALVALAAGGDPNRIRRVAVRFSRYAYPGDEVAVSVYDAGTTTGGRRAFAFEATSGGQTVLRNGWVEVE
ncbi:MaoC/PaaZ C-terminal domain-containing protein [Trujillonella endophytica]|uniref:N-terminal half of MaoC dehydratase n=1 Tax=Trujillonella endophytica TaxID=673521 RepID=A0A1H8QZ36_9ACTN|nr:MaoC/PaaZ C-terminal domain-containing protein [Trujillella endophytica]SEO59346.1 N-terminal half of MaoC dehydratase [Trujillella endophytica]